MILIQLHQAPFHPVDLYAYKYKTKIYTYSYYGMFTIQIMLLRFEVQHYRFSLKTPQKAMLQLLVHT